MKVIVTGGGTGGHIYPAIAIADQIQQDIPGTEILYIGTPNSLEEQIAQAAGYPFAAVEVKGFLRKLNIENLRRLLMAKRALTKAKKIMRAFAPDVVIGTGGYVAGPVVLAAQQCGIYTMIHEQNAFPGMTNRLLAARVNQVYLGFAAAEERLKTTAPIRTIGNPVRSAIQNPIPRAQAREKLGLPKDGRFLLISGGSGGSQRINEAVIEMIPSLIQEGIGFIFSTGARYYDEVIEQLGPVLVPNRFMAVSYIEDMAHYIAACDLAIVSAGATTIAEINAAGRASIIVPKAYSAENHQEFNARNIEQFGAGKWISEKALTADALKEGIDALWSDQDALEEMEHCSKMLYQTNPCAEIVQDIKRLKEQKGNGHA